MSEHLSRRDAVKVLGVAGASALVPLTPDSGASAIRTPPMTTVAPFGNAAPLEILPLTSTSEVFVPPRGNAFTKFSFDFPEPSVSFEGLRFGVTVFTRENAYSLDPERVTAETTPQGMRLTATGLCWAGGQERTAGHVVLDVRREGGMLEWDISAEAPPDKRQRNRSPGCTVSDSGRARRPACSLSTVGSGCPPAIAASGGATFTDSGLTTRPSTIREPRAPVAAAAIAAAALPALSTRIG